jgi:hypothetical protein
MVCLSVFVQKELIAQQVANPVGCDDLFFSEVTLSKDQNASSIFELNYAVEIYNSSSTTLNLSNYQLQLTNNSNVVTSIPLSGSLNAYTCYVVSNNLAKAAIALKSDIQHLDLDLGLNIKLDLVKNGVVIDQIGEGVANNTLGSFDYIAFMSDPYGYLANIDINLDEFTSINARRSFFVKKGDPVFSANKLIGKWAIYPSSDISNLGKFRNVCNAMADDDIVTVGFYSAKEEFCIGDPQPLLPVSCTSHDPMILNISIPGGGAVWPATGTVRVSYEPLYQLGGSLVNNCMFFGNAFSNSNAITLKPLITANATLITQGNTTSAAPVVDYEADPNVSSTDCWITATLNTGASNILSSYFPYEYKFDLDGNIFLNSVAISNGWNIMYEQAARFHTLIVKNDAEFCPKYNTSIKNFNITNDFVLQQSSNIISIKNKKSQNYLIKLFSIDGGLLYRNQTNKDVIMSVDNYAKGIYLLRIETSNGTFTSKIIL